MKTEQIYKMVPMPTGETIDLFEFHELAPAVRAAVVDRFNEENPAFFDEMFRDCEEHDIWDSVRNLEKQTGVKWQYNRWYSCDFDIECRAPEQYAPEHLEPCKDDGYYASMDMCDAWNAHIEELNRLNAEYERLGELMDNCPLWDNNYNWIEENKAENYRLEAARDDVYDQWEAEHERACVDVCNVIQSLLADAWEYSHSPEYMEEYYATNEAGYECRTLQYMPRNTNGYTGRVYYHDRRTWYTADGEEYEQSAVDHECVSIVKAS